MKIDRLRQAGEALSHLAKTADRYFSDSVGNKAQGFVPIALT